MYVRGRGVSTFYSLYLVPFKVLERVNDEDAYRLDFPRDLHAINPVLNVAYIERFRPDLLAARMDRPAPPEPGMIDGEACYLM